MQPAADGKLILFDGILIAMRLFPGYFYIVKNH